MAKHHPGKLCADFQRFYGLDSNEIGLSIDYIRASHLVAELPAESRVISALAGTDGWTTTDYLLADVIDGIKFLIWLRTEDGVKGRNRPQPYARPGVVVSSATDRTGIPDTEEEYLAYLRRDRTEVNDAWHQ